MFQILARLIALSIVALSPVLAEDKLPVLTPEERAAQNLAIATSVQDQLLSCWVLPSGYEDRSISIRLAFLGDGTLDGDPHIVPESLRTAGKYPELINSIGDAIANCLPFEGLAELGAGPGERFDITVHFSS
ncbi:hypothetical protein GGR20_001844 [Devosia subaequoris]|uniref:TonB C-terminal domain-containing protein n=1 Tax=Devosia subaequoris TaxID=395930 RepID=A0A7W6IM82_9HYPH|nr:hypothetical protein [Devosia subaequoris]MBB4052201.1 hypothetical protein [Devosia subaequoris]MCP1209364.1 hypothetical protein [Devosia subaequoris]